MQHQEYFKNLDLIERSWTKLKKNKFPQKDRDNFWRICMEGQDFFWHMRNSDIKNGFSLPKSVPSYERAIMLLENEEKYKQAIFLCEQANKLGINTDWYTKRIEKLQKRI